MTVVLGGEVLVGKDNTKTFLVVGHHISGGILAHSSLLKLSLGFTSNLNRYFVGLRSGDWLSFNVLPLCFPC